MSFVSICKDSILCNHLQKHNKYFAEDVFFLSCHIFRNKCDKQLSDKQIVELVTKRKTGLIKGFKGKNGKAFDASLVLDEQFNVGFSFPEKKAKPKK